MSSKLMILTKFLRLTTYSFLGRTKTHSTGLGEVVVVLDQIVSEPIPIRDR